MASEIKVDTVSEKTSGSGVTIDGLLIKDGGISGDVSLIGTTPTFTIGDAGAEDAALVFDGNAQDFYIALDDSADDLVIGLGSTVGTNPAVSIDENLQVIVHDNLSLLSDSSVLKFGTDGDTTLTHTDGTGLTLNSANKLTFRDTGLYVGSNADGDLDIVSDGTAIDSINIESAGGITLDAGSTTHGITYEDDGTAMLQITNSSSDVIIKPLVDAKDIIFQQYDGTAVLTIEDDATANIPAGKLAIGGTAVTSTAAELNLLDGGTSVGSSITLADADGVVVNDGGTMKTIPASDIKTYAAGGRATLIDTITLSNTSVAAFDSSDITSTYDNYLITLENVHPGSGNVEILLHASVDNGNSFYNSSGDYRFASFVTHEDQSDDSVSNRASNSSNKIGITGNRVNNGNDAALKIDATIECFSLNSSSWKKFLIRTMFSDTTDPPNLYYEHTLAMLDASQSAVNYLRVSPSSGNLASGKIKLFGLK